MKCWLVQVQYANGTTRRLHIYARRATQAARVIAEELTGDLARGIVGVKFAQCEEPTNYVGATG